MKKLLNRITVFVVFILTSCSSNSISENEDVDVFEFSYSDVNLSLTNPTQFYDGGVTRSYDSDSGLFTLQMHTVTDIYINIIFDKKGQLVDVRFFYWDNNVAVEYHPYQNFTSNYFNFYITNFDDINNRIQGNFSGKLYRDKADLNSEFIEVNCSFNLSCEYNLSYTCSCEGLLEGLGMDAAINSQDFISTNNYNGSFTNNGPYKIVVNALESFVLNQTYNYDSSSLNHYVKLYKFNIITLQYELYNSSGSVVFTSYLGNCCNSVVVKGSFNLTAINPINSNEVLEVIDGKFKYIYQY